MIFSSLNSILGYLIIRDFSMGVNWNCEACKIDTSGLKKIFHILAKNENQFSDNADDYYGLCALCLKKANNYVIIFPEEYDYAEKNKK